MKQNWNIGIPSNIRSLTRSRSDCMKFASPLENNNFIVAWQSIIFQNNRNRQNQNTSLSITNMLRVFALCRKLLYIPSTMSGVKNAARMRRCERLSADNFWIFSIGQQIKVSLMCMGLDRPWDFEAICEICLADRALALDRERVCLCWCGGVCVMVFVYKCNWPPYIYIAIYV